MPELPEVEVLVQHLHPRLAGRRVKRVRILRDKVVRPLAPDDFNHALSGLRLTEVRRRAKYLVFHTSKGRGKPAEPFLGHLGMTGRLYLQSKTAELPKHTSLVLELNRENLVFEDMRGFGRFALDTRPLRALGPEPLDRKFTTAWLNTALCRSSQPLKVRLMDQSIVAGMGNIYASESLFHARLSPALPSNQVTPSAARRLRNSIRHILRRAIRFGSTVPLHWSSAEGRDGLFYYGQADGNGESYEERLDVYGRRGLACPRCGTSIERLVQAGRSTFWCPNCQ